MPSHSERPGIWLSVWRFLLTHCLYERAAEVKARLRGCAGSPEPSLLAYAISTRFAWRGPINVALCLNQNLLMSVYKPSNFWEFFTQYNRKILSLLPRPDDKWIRSSKSTEPGHEKNLSLGGCNQDSQKPACSATEASKSLQILKIASNRIMLSR